MMHHDVKPALLTRAELEYLLGRTEVSATYSRQMKSRISRKVKTFYELELPLLQKSMGLAVTAYGHSVTASCHSQEEGLTGMVGCGSAKTINESMARGVGFEPTGPCGHGISNPTPYQARRPPPEEALSNYIILIV